MCPVKTQISQKMHVSVNIWSSVDTKELPKGPQNSSGQWFTKKLVLAQAEFSPDKISKGTF